MNKGIKISCPVCGSVMTQVIYTKAFINDEKGKRLETTSSYHKGVEIKDHGNADQYEWTNSLEIGFNCSECSNLKFKEITFLMVMHSHDGHTWMGFHDVWLEEAAEIEEEAWSGLNINGGWKRTEEYKRYLTWVNDPNKRGI